MGFNFRGTTTTADDVENSFPSIIPEQHVRYQRIHPATSVNSSSFFALLVTVLLLFIVLNSQQVSPDLLTLDYTKIWLVFGFFLMATCSLRTYARCQQLEAHAVETRDLLLHHHTQLGLQQMPLSTAYLHGLRLQLALLDQHYLDSSLEHLFFDVPAGYAMSEEEQINALPVYKYKVAVNPQSGGGALQPASSSSFLLNQKQQEIAINVEGCTRSGSEDEQTCSVCLHHDNDCTDDPWHRTLAGRCPTCKIKVGDEDSSSRVVDASYMV